MKRIVFAIAMILSIGLFVSSCKEHKKEHEEMKENHEESKEAHDELAENHTFQCPMDCEKGKTYEEKGSCPVCKMALKEQKNAEASEAKQEEGEAHIEEEGHDEDGENQEK